MTDHSASDQTATLALAEDLTIYNASAQKSILLDSLGSAAGLDLDLSQVGEIDSAGLQLLILAKREANRQGKPLHLIAHSAAVLELIDFLNLGAFFGDPLHIPAYGPARS
jgi:anti-sigma B factor antagonist